MGSKTPAGRNFGGTKKIGGRKAPVSFPAIPRGHLPARALELPVS